MTARTRRKILFSAGIVIVAAVIGLFLYFQWQRTNQEDISPYSINSDDGGNRVLIATQKSGYKDSVMAEIADHYQGEDIYISVIDVTQLSTVKPADWDKIVIFSAIKVYQFHPSVKEFLDRQSDNGKIFLYNTSDGSRMQYDDIDTVTSASVNPLLCSAAILEAIDSSFVDS